MLLLPTLIAILIAPSGLRRALSLRPLSLRAVALGTRRPRLRIGSLLAVVRPSRTAASVVGGPTFALTARTVGVKFLFRTPRHFSAAGVVLGHERCGQIRGGITRIVILSVLVVLVPLVVIVIIIAVIVVAFVAALCVAFIVIPGVVIALITVFVIPGVVLVVNIVFVAGVGRALGPLGATLPAGIRVIVGISLNRFKRRLGDRGFKLIGGRRRGNERDTGCRRR